jgi:hypothetical protein
MGRRRRRSPLPGCGAGCSSPCPRRCRCCVYQKVRKSGRGGPGACAQRLVEIRAEIHGVPCPDPEAISEASLKAGASVITHGGPPAPRPPSRNSVALEPAGIGWRKSCARRDHRVVNRASPLGMVFPEADLQRFSRIFSIGFVRPHAELGYIATNCAGARVLNRHSTSGQGAVNRSPPWNRR